MNNIADIQYDNYDNYFEVTKTSIRWLIQNRQMDTRHNKNASQWKIKLQCHLYIFQECADCLWKTLNWCNSFKNTQNLKGCVSATCLRGSPRSLMFGLSFIFFLLWLCLTGGDKICEKSCCECSTRMKLRNSAKQQKCQILAKTTHIVRLSNEKKTTCENICLQTQNRLWITLGRSRGSAALWRKLFNRADVCQHRNWTKINPSTKRVQINHYA